MKRTVICISQKRRIGGFWPKFRLIRALTGNFFIRIEYRLKRAVFKNNTPGAPLLGACCCFAFG